MKYFNLYPSTILTIGANKSCIVDIERSIYCQVPNSMGAFFLNNKRFDIEQTICGYPQEEQKIIQGYIDFLIENNFGFKTESKINFKYHDNFKNYISPFLYESLIIDSNSEMELNEIIPYVPNQQLFRFVQIRLFFTPRLIFLMYLAEWFKNNSYNNVEIVFNCDLSLEISCYIDLINKYTSVISRLVIMNAGSNDNLNNKKIILNKTELKDSTQCGIISKELFMTNIDTYIHSCLGNSCLYKKISIDSYGEIKHCPSMKHSFGNIRSVDIKRIVHRLDYQNINLISKDKIRICKDCEFRNICTDCRAFIKDDKDVYSQPAKCTYNPYISKWEGEDGYYPV